MKAMITGGSGFIGSALQQCLQANGIDSFSFDRHNCINHDVRFPTMVEEAAQGCDVIFHLAGVLGTHELFDTPHRAVDINCNGTLNILEACRRTGAAYVGITMPPVFPSIYTATKMFGQRLATAYRREYGVAVSHVRAFNAFGPGQKHGPGHPQKIIPTFAIKAWRNEPLPVWGDGLQGVDLIHTSQLAEMLVRAWEYGGDDDYFDGGTGQMHLVGNVAQIILSHTGSTESVVNLPMRRGEEPTQIKAEGEGWKKAGFKPLFRIAELLATVDSYKAEASA